MWPASTITAAWTPLGVPSRGSGDDASRARQGSSSTLSPLSAARAPKEEQQQQQQQEEGVVPRARRPTRSL